MSLSGGSFRASAPLPSSLSLCHVAGDVPAHGSSVKLRPRGHFNSCHCAGGENLEDLVWPEGRGWPSVASFDRTSSPDSVTVRCPWGPPPDSHQSPPRMQERINLLRSRITVKTSFDISRTICPKTVPEPHGQHCRDLSSRKKKQPISPSASSKCTKFSTFWVCVFINTLRERG